MKERKKIENEERRYDLSLIVFGVYFDTCDKIISIEINDKVWLVNTYRLL